MIQVKVGKPTQLQMIIILEVKQSFVKPMCKSMPQNHWNSTLPIFLCANKHQCCKSNKD